MNTSNQDYLVDDFGEQYQIFNDSKSSDVFLGGILFKNFHVGDIYWSLRNETNTMRLEDLVIFDRARGGRPWWAKLPFVEGTPPTFRGRGLGEAIIRYVIQNAERLKVKAITGDIIRSDWEATSHLAEFYAKHEFVVTPLQDDGQRIAATIYRPI